MSVVGVEKREFYYYSNSFLCVKVTQVIVDLALLYNNIIIDEDVADADNDYGGWVASDDHELYSKQCNSEHVLQSSWHVHPLRGLRAAPLSAIILSVRVTQHRLSTGLRRTGEDRSHGRVLCASLTLSVTAGYIGTRPGKRCGTIDY